MSPKLRVLRVNRPEAEQEEEVISARLSGIRRATASFAKQSGYSGARPQSVGADSEKDV